VDERDWMAERFQAHRPHLRAVAYRMLGSLTEADDAVQGTWLRLSRSRTDTSEVHNLGGWLTTLVARECLLVVLDTLTPAERLAFVLHDMFAVPFDEIAPIVGRSAPAAKMLASRARRRVHGAAVPDADLTRQREVVDAFFAAARDGDFAALVALLDPEAVVRIDGAARAGISVVRGAAAVAEQVLATGGFPRLARMAQPALVNGAAGVVFAAEGRPFAVVAFTIRQGKIAEIDILGDPARLRQLDIAVPGS